MDSINKKNQKLEDFFGELPCQSETKIFHPPPNTETQNESGFHQESSFANTKNIVPSIHYRNSRSYLPHTSLELPRPLNSNNAIIDEIQDPNYETKYSSGSATDTSLCQQFLVQAGQSMGEYGCPIHRLETNLDRAAKCLGLDASFAAVPGFILIFWDDPSKTFGSETKVVKLLQNFDMMKLELVDSLVDDVVREKISVSEGISQLSTIKKLAPIYPWYVKMFSYALASMAVAPLAFSGGWKEAFLSFFLGAIVYFLELLGSKFTEFRNIVEFTSALFVSFVAASLSDYVCYGSVVLSSLVVILPGMIMTNGFIEISARSKVTGTISVFYAIIIMLLLTFGIEVGKALELTIFKNPDPQNLSIEISKCVPINKLWWILFFPIAILSINISLNIPFKRWFLVIFTSSLMFGTFILFNFVFKINQFATISASFVLGLSANIISRINGVPPFISILPATMVLVPGSVGVRSFTAIFDGQSGMDLISLNVRIYKRKQIFEVYKYLVENGADIHANGDKTLGLICENEFTDIATFPPENESKIHADVS
ncbi:hypothetical protein BB559_002268 [Furculomyces boomerangus]|uniref:Threonine/serine exporter-like N-terminal domain-containing protein n=1 Tax=Furculomyces boomerangus TaxID=61424 RepID=A0A2T9YWN1_9FUNG|nr:hypothetical protein BB559_002268 [Furculomyces boomerangus]